MYPEKPKEDIQKTIKTGEIIEKDTLEHRTEVVTFPDTNKTHPENIMPKTDSVNQSGENYFPPRNREDSRTIRRKHERQHKRYRRKSEENERDAMFSNRRTQYYKEMSDLLINL